MPQRKVTPQVAGIVKGYFNTSNPGNDTPGHEKPEEKKIEVGSLRHCFHCNLEYSICSEFGYCCNPEEEKELSPDKRRGCKSHI